MERSITPLETIILATIRAASPNGLTTNEITDATGIELVTISPRTRPMTRKGVIQDSGQRREGKSGRMSIVWIEKTATQERNHGL